MPMSPISPSCFTASFGKVCSTSHFRALDRSSFAANSRQRSRTWRCSSVSWKSISRAPRARSGALPVGGPLLQKGLHALAGVLGREGRGERLALELVRDGEVRVGAGVHRALRERDGDRTLRGDLP